MAEIVHPVPAGGVSASVETPDEALRLSIETGGGLLTVAGSADAEASRLSFRNWLLNGGGLYGVDGEKHSGRKRGRKKNQKSQGHSSDGGPKGSMPAMEAREVSSGGKKKTRRWLNDLLLRELAGPLEASDVAALYAPPPWGVKTHRPALERITEISPWHAERLDRSLWDLILSSDMDQRERVLHMNVLTRLEPTGGSGEPRAAGAAAVKAWCHVSGPAKDALRKSSHWPVVALVEEKLLLLKHAHAPPVTHLPQGATTPLRVDLLRTSPHGTAPDLATDAADARAPEHTAGFVASESALSRHGQTSCDQPAAGLDGWEMVEMDSESAPHPGISSSGGAPTTSVNSGDSLDKGDGSSGAVCDGDFPRSLVFGADDSFVRLIIHGLCQFHGLQSASLDVAEARIRCRTSNPAFISTDWEDAERVVFVSLDRCRAGTDPLPSSDKDVFFRLSDVLTKL